MRNHFFVSAAVVVCLLFTQAASAATFVNGFVPDWNQPNWHGANGPNGGPAAPAWNAWCVPTASANLIGHWEDARNVLISDGAAYNASGVNWPNWPAYQDYQANGAATRGILSPGSSADSSSGMSDTGVSSLSSGGVSAGSSTTGAPSSKLDGASLAWLLR